MKLIIHIGLPKTATTFLQNGILRGRPGYLGKSKKDRTDESLALDQVFRPMVLRDTVFSPEVVDEKLESWYAKAEKVALDSGVDRIIISDEVLCAWPVDKVGRSTYWPILNWGAQRYCEIPREGEWPIVQFLQRNLMPLLKKRGDEVTIVLTMRHQLSYLGSLYSQQSHRIFDAGEGDFSRQVGRLEDRKDPSTDWWKLYSSLCEVAGTGAVKVLFFEDIKKAEYWRGIRNAFEIDLSDEEIDGLLRDDRTENKRAGAVEGVWSLRSLEANYYTNFIACLINPYMFPRLRKFLLFVAGKIDALSIRRPENKDLLLNSGLRKKIFNSHVESNKKLGEALKKDLSDIGYY